MITTDETPKTTAAAQVRAVLRVRGLAELFERRPDLAGVHLPADLTVEAVLWSV